MQFYGDNFVVTNHVCSKEEAATTFSLLLHILAFSWHSKVFVYIVGTPQAGQIGLHNSSLLTICCVGDQQVRKGGASADVFTDVACFHRYGAPPRIMRLWPMLLLEDCWELVRTLACLSSLVCLLLKVWSRSAPFLHPTLSYLQLLDCHVSVTDCGSIGAEGAAAVDVALT